MRQRIFVRVVLMVFMGVALLPAGAQAQSGIAGVVRDSLGSVLPGVTVEASSPVLIERVRTVVTNGEGLYRVIDLRPGTYTVTFTLPAFDTVIREGIVLQANFTANVNVELPIGTLLESITVTGETPVVDISSAQRESVLTQDLLEALPSSRTWGTNTVPAITRVVDVGGSSAVGGLRLRAYGDNDYWNVLRVDGMSVNAAGMWPGIYYNYDTLEEVVYQPGGGDAEATTSGVIVNMIPRQGGNQFSADATLIFSNRHMSSSNLTDELKERGLTAPDALEHLHDANGSVGGPILRDKLWFFASYRNWTTNSFKANAFNSDGSQAVDRYKMNNATGRVTYQISQRNKLSGQYDFSSKVQASRGFGNGFSPEATYRSRTSLFPPSGNSITTWTSAVSNQLLINVGFSTQIFQLFGVYQPEVAGPSADNPFGDIAKRDVTRGRTFNAAPNGETFLDAFTYNVSASVSYVTGSHSFKVGQQFASARNGSGTVNQNGSLVQQYRDGVPDSVVVYNTPTNVQTNLDYKVGLYAQDSWRINRLTFNPGIRFDIHRNSIPAQHAAAGRFVPERNFAAIPNIINWNDVSLRLGAAYDLFGNGKTAIKVSVGRYPQFEIANQAARYNPMTLSGGTGSSVRDTRTWDDLNGNDIAEENELGPTTNARFGLGLDRFVDPDLDRPYSWMTSIGIQQELRPGWGLSAAYTRRDQGQLIWTDNRNTTFDDYTLLTLADPRGNGQTLPLYNLNVDKLGLVDLFDTNSDENQRFYDGLEFSVDGRFGGGGRLVVASNVGRVRVVNCEVNDPNALRFCDETKLDSVPFLTSFRVVYTYPLRGGFNVSGVYQSTPGGRVAQPIFATNYRVTRAIVPNLTLPSVTVRLDEPGSQTYAHIHQLDLAVSKEFRSMEGMQISPRLEVHNALNVSPVLSQVTTFGSSLGRPQRLLQGRMVRLFVRLSY